MGSQLLHTSDDLWYNGSPTSGHWWDDDDDATFGSITQTGPTPTSVAFMYSWIDPYTGPITPDATITLLTRIQVSTTELGSSIPFGAVIAFDIPGGGSTIPYTDAQWVTGTVPNDGLTHNLSFPLTSTDLAVYGFTIEETLTRLAGGDSGMGTGPGLRALRFKVVPEGSTLGSGVTRWFYIFEASVLVEWPAPTTVIQETRRHFPPARKL